MYKVEFAKSALKDLQKLDKSVSAALISWIDKNLNDCENPRVSGKALKGNLGSFWRYRIGDYRILANIIDNRLIILLVKIGHRKEVYR